MCGCLPSGFTGELVGNELIVGFADDLCVFARIALNGNSVLLRKTPQKPRVDLLGNVDTFIGADKNEI